METDKTIKSPLVILAIVYSVFTALYFLLRLFGYILVPASRLPPTVMSTVITAIMVLLTVKGMKNRDTGPRCPCFVTMFLPLLASLFVLGKAIGYDIDGIELYTLVPYGYIALICSMVLFFGYVKKKSVRIGLGVVYTALLIPVFILLVIIDFAPKPVLMSEISPNGEYRADVKADRVEVIPQGKNIHIGIGTLRKDPVWVYDREAETIRWETDGILYIDDIPHRVR
jgi:hypothetical protein